MVMALVLTPATNQGLRYTYSKLTYVIEAPGSGQKVGDEVYVTANNNNKRCKFVCLTTICPQYTRACTAVCAQSMGHTYSANDRACLAIKSSPKLHSLF